MKRIYAHLREIYIHYLKKKRRKLAQNTGKIKQKTYVAQQK